MRVKIFTDGAARGNPGNGASGFDIYENSVLKKSFVKYNGICTNNFSEYTAIILALKWCRKNLKQDDEIEIVSDSLLVVSQIAGKFKVRSQSLAPLSEEVARLKSYFKSVRFSHVVRTNTGVANVDRKLNLFLDRKERV
ncbi:MAG: ribonuclease HI family protein [Candidatus Marsarchaeota archaeon]|nr:ribonuclease HI family protein [Candidatus Marsarchaeota archaeon]MCL5105861.1 ribonuclease HI family protein [Candidatus Marsarchaeota archaeon]